MEKILKNTTNADIPLDALGLPDILANNQVAIQIFDYDLLGSDDSINYLTTLINSGDIVVNDGTNDLTSSEALRYLKIRSQLIVQQSGASQDKVVKTLNFDGDVVITDNGDGKLTITAGTGGVVKGKLFDFGFNNVGKTSNKWLQFASSSAPSNEVPMPSPYDAELVAITYSNTKDNSGTDIEIHKNGVLLTTWQIRNKRTSWKTDFSNINVLQGDRVSVFFKKVGGQVDPTTPVISVYFSVTSHNEGEGGTQSGV